MIDRMGGLLTVVGGFGFEGTKIYVLKVTLFLLQ